MGALVEMMKFVLYLAYSLTILRSDGGVSVNNPYYCYSQDPIRPQIGMFATTTPYEVVRGRHIDANVSNCTPSKFWMWSRHGARLPARSEVARILDDKDRLHGDILKNYEAGRASLCASDFELLRNWQFHPNITLENDQDLTTSGWNELKDSATRLQAAFPTLLTNEYSPSRYFFRPSATQRTLDSLRAFADGLFGPNGSDEVLFEEAPVPDLLLVPYENCELYSEVIRVYAEQMAFAEGPEFQEMLSQVSAKLGFHGSQHLRANEIETIMMICKYEQLWALNSTSPFCAAFSIANHQVHEYYKDLEYYFRYGYGHTNYRTLFENFNCHLLQDLLRFFQSNDPSDHTVRVFNGHLVSLQILLVTFGALEDKTPLNRHNFAQQTNRMWRGSVITPMAANLVVVRYE